MSQVMSYEAWRITYQSSEQAARAAYEAMVELQGRATTISESDRLELTAALGLLRGHQYHGSADALERVLRGAGSLAAVQQGVQPEPWCPDVCPITGRKFFMWIEHWETGKDVPTYGGPYDSYTIPVKDSDGTFSCERYDHDAGEWMTEGMGWECVGLMLVDDQSFVVEPNNPRYMEIEHFATHPTQQGLDAQQLHSDIMNLPCVRAMAGRSAVARIADDVYRQGFQNARHAAAELVLAAQAKQGGV